MNETTLSIAEDLEAMLNLGFSGSELAEMYGPHQATRGRITRPVDINDGPAYFDVMVFDDASVIAFTAPENDEVRFHAYRPGTSEWFGLMLLVANTEPVKTAH